MIPVLLPETDLEQSLGFLLLDTWVNLRDSLEDRAAIDSLVSAAKGELFSTPVAAPITLSPYRTLRPFREEDAPLFFGREVFIQDLLNKVLSRHYNFAGVYQGARSKCRQIYRRARARNSGRQSEIIS